MKNLIHSLLVIISICLIIIGVNLKTSSIDDFLSTFLISIGTSLLVALTVAKIFEYFSLKKIDDKFSYWNKKAALASLSGIVGEEIPEEIADNLIKIIDVSGLRRSEYNETYRFTQISGHPICILSLSFTVKNFNDKAKIYPFRHELHKGFLSDYGQSLKFVYSKIYNVETNKVLYENENRERKETGNSFYFSKKVRIKPNHSIRIISVIQFNINNSFSFFDSFFQPIQGIKIKLEHDFTDATLGFSSAKFWKERFVKEYADKNVLEINYSGVVFPGQGIGIWMHINNL